MPNQMNFMPGGGNANSNTWFSNYINQQNEMNNKKKISNNQIGVNQKNSKSYAGSQLNVSVWKKSAKFSIVFFISIYGDKANFSLL